MISDQFKLQIHEICQNSGIKKLSIFGSQARGDTHPDSDVDLLVEFNQNPGLIGFIKTKHRFEDLFKLKVDLVTPTGLSKYISPHIQSDLTVLYG